MKKILSQKEIDRLICGARSGTEAVVPVQSQSVTAWDGRLASRMGQDQMQVLNRVHQILAHNLTRSLGAYLRIHFVADLVLGEHLSYSEFLQSIPEVTYLASCKLMPTGDTVVAQLDLSVAYPVIDVLLGGEGKGEVPNRAMTQIEEQILESVMHIVCRELQNAWQSLSLQVEFEQRQDARHRLNA